MEWRQIDLPDSAWVPHGLHGALRLLPPWAARGAAESRFLGEVSAFAAVLASGPQKLVADLPPGEGRGVLVLPGFGFGDPATTPLQVVLRAAGYRVHLSKIMFNIHCPDDQITDLVQVAEEGVLRNGGEPLLVVGHSRGGMLARGLAVRRPDLVSRAICMGAPLNYEFAFYEMPRPFVEVLTGVHRLDRNPHPPQCFTHECSCPYMLAARRPVPPEVDLVSLYTRSDGVVDWRACVVPGARNIEVSGSHLGMGMRPDTLRVVLQELAAVDNRTATGTRS